MKVDHRVTAVAAVAGGFLLGFLDFVWIKFMPYPFADLGNSAAVWAVAAFAFGYWVRFGWVRATLGAATLLVIAVPSYYLAAALIQNDDLANIWAFTSMEWMLFGVLAGVVFGVAGIWARDVGWRQIIGIAMPAAVLFTEAVLSARRVGDPDYGNDTLWNVVIDAVLGVLVIVLAARTARRRAVALAAALPVALVGFAAFSLAGFG
ncbi:MAG: hypothetical protein QOC94_2548 [Actinoplanes sp.]|jgi:hypothetical protein|nr:hypothetical protein [Actinoplanes sp.]